MNNNKWIKGAIILSLSFLISIVLVKPIGVSTQFSVLTGIIHSTIDKDVITQNSEGEYESTNAYYNKSDGKLAKAIKNPINYDFIFVLAIPLGSYIAYKTSKKDDEKDNIKLNICDIEKDQIFIEKYYRSFLGGFLLLFGARFAGGCTSGHMMSGMMQGSVSGYVFAMVVFMVAIPTAILITKNKSKED